MRFGLTATVLMAICLGGCDSIGGGRDNVVNGDGNLVVTDDTVDRVAARLAGFDTTPEVTDTDLESIYQTIRQGAARGDLRSSLVILQIAAAQRAPAEPDTPDD